MAVDDNTRYKNNHKKYGKNALNVTKTTISQAQTKYTAHTNKNKARKYKKSNTHTNTREASVENSCFLSYWRVKFRPHLSALITSPGRVPVLTILASVFSH